MTVGNKLHLLSPRVGVFCYAIIWANLRALMQLEIHVLHVAVFGWLNVVYAKLRERPAVSPFEQLNHHVVIALGRYGPIQINCFYGAQRQTELHVVLDRIYQIGIATACK